MLSTAAALLRRQRLGSRGGSAGSSLFSSAPVTQSSRGASPELTGQFLRFTAAKTEFAAGLPDFVDHAQIHNRPNFKREWRKEQAKLPKDIAMLQRRKTLQVRLFAATSHQANARGPTLNLRWAWLGRGR